MEINKMSLINFSDHIVLLQCLMMKICRTCLKQVVILIHMNLESTTTKILEVACVDALKQKHNHRHHHKMRQEKVRDKVSSRKCKVDPRVDKSVASALKS